MTGSNVDQMTPVQRYIVSMYYAVVTMTTTGYGDIGGHYSRGFFAAIFIVIIGMIVFAYALSVLAATLANTDAPKYGLSDTLYAGYLLTEDFRAIAISAITSKVFEYCFIEKFSEFISTDNKQFGFKKGWVVAMLYTLSAVLLSASLKEGIQLICVQST